MIKVLLFSVLIFICFSSFGQGKNLSFPSVIYLAATNWCPYSCDQKSNTQKGMVHDYLTYIFREHGIELEITFFPWSRAIKEVKKGRVDGLLTAVPTEAPGLLFTHTPTMNYSVCFFTEVSSDWEYKKIESLRGITLAVIQDYAYGEPVDKYIQTSPKNNLSVIKSGGIARLQRMLLAQRFDAFIADSNVVAWQLTNTLSSVRKAGCLDEKPFYLAFNPRKEWSGKIIEVLDVWLGASSSQRRLQSIKSDYLK